MKNEYNIITERCLWLTFDLYHKKSMLSSRKATLAALYSSCMCVDCFKMVYMDYIINNQKLIYPKLFFHYTHFHYKKKQIDKAKSKTDINEEN